MHSIWQLFQDYTFQTVALGAGILGMTSGVLGCFAVLRRQSLIGDGVSHAALPGVVLAFILLQSKNTELLLLGALISGILATLLMLGIVNTTRIRFDSALALVMSVFFGLGMVLLTYVQKMPNANQAGLSRFIFGQASTLLRSDITWMIASGVVLMGLVILLWKELKLLAFDPEFAHNLGFVPRRLSIFLSLMMVLAIIIGLQTVGVILMSALLISPAVAARQWSNRLSVMVVLAAGFGAISGILGTLASSLVPKLPTGPAIVVVISAIVLISILFAPGRGVIARAQQQRRNRKNYTLWEEVAHGSTD